MNAKIDISNIKLETDRLILRTWEITDLDNFFEYASINGVGEKAGWEHHKSKDESLEILKMFIDEKKVFAIVLKENQNDERVKKLVKALQSEKVKKYIEEKYDGRVIPAF